jgi:hypothetical protein
MQPDQATTMFNNIHLLFYEHDSVNLHHLQAILKEFSLKKSASDMNEILKLEQGFCTCLFQSELKDITRQLLVILTITR